MMDRSLGVHSDGGGDTRFDRGPWCGKEDILSQALMSSCLSFFSCSHGIRAGNFTNPRFSLFRLS